MQLPHRLPNYTNCGEDSIGVRACQQHYRVSESMVQTTFNTISGSNPFTPGTGSILVHENRYELVSGSNGYVTESLASCQKTAWKALLGSKSWHGMWGYGQNDYCIDDFRDGCNCGYEDAKPSIPDTKYLSITATGTLTYHVFFGPEIQVTMTATSTVDRYSGVITATFVSSSGSFVSQSFLTPTDVGVAYTALQDFLSDAANFNCTRQAELPECCFSTPSINNEYNFTCQHGGCTEGDSWLGNDSYSITDITATTFTREGKRNLTSGGYLLFTITVTKGSPYTSNDVHDDIDALLPQFPLDEDVVLPWRTDEVFNVTPYISYDEVQGGVSPLPGLFTNGSIYSGSYSGMIIGLPTPTNVTLPSGSLSGSTPLASYRNYFAPHHYNYHLEFGGDSWFLELDEAPEPFTGSTVPPLVYGATEYTPDPICKCAKGTPIGLEYGLGLSPLTTKGALQGYGGEYGSRLYKRLWAETLLFSKPSHNWSRPCTNPTGSHFDELQREPSTQDCSTGGDQEDIVYDERQGLFVPTCASASVSGTFIKPCGDLRFPLITGCNDTSSSRFWNDEARKFEFVKLEWIYDPRSHYDGQRLMTQSLALAACMAEFDLHPADEDYEPSMSLCGCGLEDCGPSTQWCDEILWAGDLDTCIGADGTGPFGIGPCCDPEDWNGFFCTNPRSCTEYDCCCSGSAPYGHNGIQHSPEACRPYTSSFTVPAPTASLRPVNKALSDVRSTDVWVRYEPCKVNAYRFVASGSESITSSKHNFKTFAMPRIPLDERYGSYWKGDVAQWMTDPLWLPPMRPCSTGSRYPECSNITVNDYYWLEAVGAYQGEVCGDAVPGIGDLCPEDWKRIGCEDFGCNSVRRYYPMRPFVEARTSPPTSSCFGTSSVAPTPPAGSRRLLDCSNYIAYRDAGNLCNEDSASLCCPQCNEPWVGNHPATAVVPNVIYPWKIKEWQDECATNGGRFAESYIANNASSGNGYLLMSPY